jgi:hypothetical protein
MIEIAGLSISTTCRSAQSACAPACPTTRLRGLGLCGIYPGTKPGEHRSGIAATFDDARAAYSQAWQHQN